ncbi:MAG: PAS domain-containing sensor histidine kinase [Euryarchaeota archaeon]|nr:PAS domain-containing sensor histidine kinase [Euryarchaeota archaeon]
MARGEASLKETQKTARARETPASREAIFDHAAVGLYRLDPSGRILVANPALLQMLGYESLETLASEDPGAGPHHPETALKQFLGNIASHGARGIETRWRRRDGTTLTARETIVPVRDAVGSVVFYDATVEDVTALMQKDDEYRKTSERLAELVKLQTELLNNIVEENTKRKQVEEELRSANERLKDLAKMKTQLLNSVSHELSTPLTPIMLQLYLIRTGRVGSLSDEQKHAVDLLDRNLARLSMLVKDVLDVSRIEAGKLRLDRQETDIAAIVEEAVDSFKAPAKTGNVTLEIRGNAPTGIKADKRRIGQVMYNLLSNALKFSNAGGRVTIEMGDQAGAALVRVSDEGLGIRPEDIPKLFQAFSQVHDTMQKTHAGTGLGLYICRGIIEQHGGRIWCESEGLRRGTTFAFTIPKGDVAEGVFEFVA